MTKTIKIFTALIVCILMLSTSCICVFANEIMPLWDNIAACRIDMNFYAGVGTATGTTVRKSGVTLLEGTINIYKNVNGSWVFVDSVNKSVSVGSLTLSLDFNATQGTEYKAVFTIYAYRGTTAETHTMESIKTYS